MKQLLILFIFFCWLDSDPCPAQQSPVYFNDKDSTHISGIIIGFKPGGGDDFISFLVYDLSGNSKKNSFQISPDGSFDIAILQYFEGDITLNYSSAFTSIFARPGTHLQIDIQNGAIKEGKRWGRDVFSAKDASSETNNLIFDFESNFRDHIFSEEPDMGNKQQTDSTFAAHQTRSLAEELVFLDNFISTKKAENIEFAAWQRNHLIYAAGHKILLFPFLGKMNTTVSDRQLLAFVKSIPVNNSSAIHNSAYYDFLDMLVRGHQIIVNINPVYAAARKESGNNAIPVNLGQIDKLADGIVRELLYYDLYLSHFKSPSRKNITGAASEPFESVIRDPVLKKMFKTLSDAVAGDFKPYNVLNRIRGLKVSDNLKTRLLSTFENRTGTNLFIDFWGDWCGPCMMEMPTYPKLIAAFENKPLKFVFFSVNTRDKNVEKVKEKYQIEADFINLTNDEVAMMNEVFEFHSYPSHFVVNSQGDVVANNTKRAEDLERLLSNPTAKP